MEVLALQKGRTALPTYQTPGAAGLDLPADLETPLTLVPGQRVAIPTGWAFQLPMGVVGLIFSRSGQSRKHGVRLTNGVGVLDSDYTGEVQVLLENGGQEPYTIEPGDRIAQLVFLSYCPAQVVVVDDLEETQRGTGGFGSTGKA